MIEFTGYLSGAARHYFLKKSRKLAEIVVLVGGILSIPMMIPFFRFADPFFFTVLYAVLILMFFLMLRWPKNEKKTLSILPQKIIVEEDCIVCIADTYTETRYVDDVCSVTDRGEFYEMKFPFGQISDKFICQKSLLTKGSLDAFESFFQDKLTRE